VIQTRFSKQAIGDLEQVIQMKRFIFKKNHCDKDIQVYKERRPVDFSLGLKNVCKSSSSLKSENFGESETSDRIYF